VEPKNGLIRYVFPADRQQPTQVSFRLHTQSPGMHHLHLGVGSIFNKHFLEAD
jgi:protein-L-isoaspartate(D-aspartate) O-methyltransferase